MVKLDAVGKVCPIPVIMAKKELEKGQPFMITVDNETAVGNLTRLANTRGCTIKTEKGEGHQYTLEFSAPSEAAHEEKHAEEYAVFFNKETVGSGDDELGANLAKMMLYTLTESEDLPAYVLLMNGGVKLATDEETAAHLKTLEQKGVTVMVCGTCLNFFGIKDQCRAGIVSNMYDIVSAMQKVSKVITA